MKHLVYIIMLWIPSTAGYGQVTFAGQGMSLEVMDQLHFNDPIQYDIPVTQGEHPYVILFKQYFHPSSFEVFKGFSLPEDWMGHTVEAFQEWQERLSKDKLFLQHIFHLKDEAGLEFLVFQYYMVTPEYILERAMAMKRVQGSWKHIHLKKDQHALMLMQIGLINLDFYPDVLAGKSERIMLDHVQSDKKRSYKERFSRADAFEPIRNVLLQKGVSESDIAHAQSLFSSKDDQGLIEFISVTYKIDNISLMEEINQRSGFRLYNFIRTNESQ